MYQLLTNGDRRSHLQTLQSLMSGCSNGFIAVAFLKHAGLRSMLPELEAVLGRGGTLRMVVGSDFYLTEPKALWELDQLARKFERFDWKLARAESGSTFHPKYYRFDDGTYLWVVTGSANMTSGGLGSNVEVSMLVEDNLSSPMGRQASLVEDEFWNNPRCEVASEHALERYQAEYDLFRTRIRSVEEQVRAELAEVQIFESERLKIELELYKTDPEETRQLEERRSNYEVAKARLLESTRKEEISEKEFGKLYRDLVGEGRDNKLWHSGSIHRGKEQVLEQWPSVLEMVMEIAADLDRTPEEMYEVGVRWKDKIKGVGPNIFTEFCHTFNPLVFAPLNRNPLASLRWLRIATFPEPAKFKAFEYGRYCRCLDELRRQCGFQDLGEMDHFLNYIYWKHAKKGGPETDESLEVGESL